MNSRTDSSPSKTMGMGMAIPSSGEQKEINVSSLRTGHDLVNVTGQVTGFKMLRIDKSDCFPLGKNVLK